MHLFVLFNKWFAWFVGFYLIGLNGSYILFNLLAFVSLRKYVTELKIAELKKAFKSSFYPPISVLVPAFNEEATIAETVRSMLQLQYPEYEIVVINDGSKDQSMAILKESFDLVELPLAAEYTLPCQPIRKVYLSRESRNLIVIDKENGGKADSLNAGINVSRHPLFCGIDADSILERDCLLKVVSPMVNNPTVVAVGGIVRIANGCKVSFGEVARVGISRSHLVRFQIVEYLRAFLFGRVGLNELNSTLIISGAFGLFKKEIVIKAGGYDAGTVGEDMELVTRIHRKMREWKQPYRVTFVPDPVCWTEAPESFRIWQRQRNRWQRGLTDTMLRHRAMLFNPRYGIIGMFAMPYFFFFEMLGPIVESLGYVLVPLAWTMGLVNTELFFLFLIAMTILGIILSVSALVLEELSFRRYPKLSHLFILFAYSVLENLGYRQYHSFVRLKGILDYMAGKKHWGAMKRKGFSG